MNFDCVIIANIDMLREDKKQRINVFSSPKYTAHFLLNSLQRNHYNIWNLIREMYQIKKVHKLLSQQNSMLIQNERKEWNCIDLLNYIRAGKQVPHITPDTVKKYLTWFTDLTLNGCFLYSYLERNGLSCRLIQTFDYEPRTSLERIFASAPLVTVISTTFITLDNILAIKEVSDYIKKHSPATKIILGSWALYYNLTHYPEFLKVILNFCDFIIYEPQGYQTLLKLILTIKKNKDISQVNNLIYQTKGKIIRTPLKREKNSINDHPINWDKIIKIYKPRRVRIATSQGCPFTCRFCNFREHPLEYKSIEVLRKELHTVKSAGINKIDFVDDLFCHPEERLIKICKMMLKEKFNFRWFCLSRASGLKKETIKLMAEAGCELVNIGMESADPNVLFNIDKKTDVEQAYQQLENFRKYGITIFCDFFIGFPGETEETINNTLKFLNTACINAYSLFLFILQRGTLIDTPQMREKFNLKGEYIAWNHYTGNSLKMVKKMSTFIRNVKDEILKVRGLEDIHILIDEGYTSNDLKVLAKITKQLFTLGTKSKITPEDIEKSSRLINQLEEFEYSHSKTLLKNNMVNKDRKMLSADKKVGSDSS
ncbi:MAG: hypothetical protein B6D55_03795 [Candidatus Omnitrophica bacterium 4484_70.2]|nr:MAG: hypothetical protein B6D55_03795 [Candidatus Omnitrophica bacterium 4484_70.2]